MVQRSGQLVVQQLEWLVELAEQLVELAEVLIEILTEVLAEIVVKLVAGRLGCYLQIWPVVPVVWAW